MGRRSLYSPDLAKKILVLMYQGTSMQRIARMRGMPSMRTMRRWAYWYPYFGDKYKVIAEAWRMQRIAVGIATDIAWIESKPGGKTSQEAAEMRRLYEFVLDSPEAEDIQAERERMRRGGSK